jgi:two-component system capsular synthesis sensor histidine kinase RcsC
VGYFYALTPVYLGNRLQAMLGVEQTIRMESFFTPGSLPMGVTILDDNGQPLISLAGRKKSRAELDAGAIVVWLHLGFRELVLKKACRRRAEYCLFRAGGYGAGADPHADPQRHVA